MFCLKQLHVKGLKIKQIARMTGHDPKTVRKYIKAQELPLYNPRSPRPSKLDPFKSYLLTRIQERMLNCNVLLDEIRWPGRRFVNIDALNEQARTWCAKANRRVHSTAQAVLAEQLAQERLQPLPTMDSLEATLFFQLVSAVHPREHRPHFQQELGD